MKVSNKALVVTGAGSGIGRELALSLVSRGASVAGVDLSREAFDETAVPAGRYARQFGAFVAAVSQRPAVDLLPEWILARFSAIDGIFYFN